MGGKIFKFRYCNAVLLSFNVLFMFVAYFAVNPDLRVLSFALVLGWLLSKMRFANLKIKNKARGGIFVIISVLPFQ